MMLPKYTVQGSVMDSRVDKHNLPGFPARITNPHTHTHIHTHMHIFGMRCIYDRASVVPSIGQDIIKPATEIVYRSSMI